MNLRSTDIRVLKAIAEDTDLTVGRDADFACDFRSFMALNLQRYVGMVSLGRWHGSRRWGRACSATRRFLSAEVTLSEHPPTARLEERNFLGRVALSCGLVLAGRVEGGAPPGQGLLIKVCC